MIIIFFHELENAYETMKIFMNYDEYLIGNYVIYEQATDIIFI